ncbi:MAG: glutamine--tRNA ligase/YqeY domain fusion protein [Saprospiraceae bacterium]|jgi:glutaminyl-tRNA synthetase|nr:glutamine--tRNA ligase/YqeY domain fusion protein [Saprospiraceae bacterium]MBK6816316.1 glutamine--tRNA ligase/YqeY domain fusion protein [Saprospiraceae bacterium]MBK7438138.1 glutamine--tRNA ligase/YqeY domain fusion protein [Saprospiraceae bacterium]MBK7609213.1 glutamine--tRNA ligase/YqeY domain fusion protein [Saprospiraceae bacterium]MBK8280624.1 glutamine--tRNA ligase/YqeY domain fusion protein [Saprospiraceae bacterium]
MSESLNFIEEIIQQDVAENKHQGRVLTRFPPEPNGYLHIGHAKSICLNFGVAQKFGGRTNLRFDDTNPEKEDIEYVESIKDDIRWLGFEWDKELYASDYFEQLYAFAVQLIKDGKAYVDHSSADEIAQQKGTPTVPGTPSPYRDRSVDENLELFENMKAGVFEEGECVLRAKIDLATPNMLLRDPLMYRIKKDHHHRTGDQWVIYPMYDFAHGQSDSIEQITHSICTLEFENHRPLYDWFIAQLGIFPSHQYEFARLNLTYTVMSKRKLLQLVQEGFVKGWDDPRMPTITGLRRRGFTPESIRDFADRIGVAKRENIIDVSLLEFCVREHLNKIASRFMVVQDPVRLRILNYEEGKTEMMHIVNNPENEAAGARLIPFCNELYVERDDYMEIPSKGYFRLYPGGMVRLKNGYIIKCERGVSNPHTGELEEIQATYFPESRSGQDTSGLQVKGVIHWVSAAEAVNVELRIYDRLFTDESPDGHEDKDFKEFINSDSLKVIPYAKAEPNIINAQQGDRYQFLRSGYYCLDADSRPGHLVFNRTVTLKDAWAKKK